MNDCSWYNVEADGDGYPYNINEIKDIIDKSYIYTEDMYNVESKQPYKEYPTHKGNIGKIIMDDADELPSLMRDIIENIFLCERHRND